VEHLLAQSPSQSAAQSATQGVAKEVYKSFRVGATVGTSFGLSADQFSPTDTYGAMLAVHYSRFGTGLRFFYEGDDDNNNVSSLDHIRVKYMEFGVSLIYAPILFKRTLLQASVTPSFVFKEEWRVNQLEGTETLLGSAKGYAFPIAIGISTGLNEWLGVGANAYTTISSVERNFGVEIALMVGYFPLFKE